MRLFWPLLVMFQLYLAIAFALQPFNAARGSYRHEERAAAFQAVKDHPSPETKAALQTELTLNAKHISFQQDVLAAIVFAVFLVLDLFGCYGWKNFRKNFGNKSPGESLHR